MTKWYSHLKGKIDKLVDSHKTKKIICGIFNVEITMKNGDFYKFGERDIEKFEEFLDRNTRHIPDDYQQSLLIEKLDRAEEEGRISGYTIIGRKILVFHNRTYAMSFDSLEACVVYVKSLYRDEFTIENIDDIDRVKVDQLTVVTLANGERLSVVRKCNNGLLLWQRETGVEELVRFIALKGAKVVQAC